MVMALYRALHQQQASGHGCACQDYGMQTRWWLGPGPCQGVSGWWGVTHRRVVVAVVLELHGEVDDGADRRAALALGLP